VLCFFLGHQHFIFKLRRSALLRKEVAVSKGEIEKCTSATHDSANIGSGQKPVKTFFKQKKGNQPQRHEATKNENELFICGFVSLWLASS
jgi:hypothetical protein